MDKATKTKAYAVIKAKLDDIHTFVIEMLEDIAEDEAIFLDEIDWDSDDENEEITVNTVWREREGDNPSTFAKTGLYYFTEEEGLFTEEGSFKWNEIGKMVVIAIQVGLGDEGVEISDEEVFELLHYKREKFIYSEEMQSEMFAVTTYGVSNILMES